MTRQQLAIYNLLCGQDYPEGLTRLQIAHKLGIERASICRRVSELMDKNRLWVVKKGLCPISGTRAEFLTCNRAVYMTRPVQKTEQSGNLF